MERPARELPLTPDLLQSELAELRRRLDRVEEKLSLAPPSRSTTPTPPTAAEVTEPPASNLSAELALVGRSLIVFGGAYLLRAITDSGALPPVLGSSAALAYTLVLLWLSDRAAGAGRQTSAGFHAFTSLAIGYPLLWETTLRLAIVGPATGAMALVAFYSLALLVAWRRDFSALAWGLTIAALGGAVTMAFGTQHLLPFIVALFCVAAEVEALAYRGHWRGLRWPAALTLDLMVLSLAALATRPEGLPESFAAFRPPSVVAIELALPTLYLGSIALRTLISGRAVTVFGIAQCTLALLVGIGGAARELDYAGASIFWLGVITLVLAATSYAAAFIHTDGDRGHARNFYFYSSIAGALALTGTPILFGGRALAIVWSASALGASVAALRLRRSILHFHAAASLVAAMFATGLARAAFEGFVSSGPWPPVPAIAYLVLIVGLACYALSTFRSGDEASSSRRLPQLVLGGWVAALGIGLMERALATVLPGAHGLTVDPAFVATVRTGALSAAAVLLACLARWPRVRELGSLCYPILVIGAAKLLLEDLPVGRPVSLFLTLALFGSALLLTPRLLRQRGR